MEQQPRQWRLERLAAQMALDDCGVAGCRRAGAAAAGVMGGVAASGATELGGVRVAVFEPGGLKAPTLGVWAPPPWAGGLKADGAPSSGRQGARTAPSPLQPRRRPLPP